MAPQEFQEKWGRLPGAAPFQHPLAPSAIARIQQSGLQVHFLALVLAASPNTLI